MARCANCGGLLGPDAEWCGQCFTVVGHPEAERRDPHPPPPPPPPPTPAPTPTLTAAAALAAIPPDIQITLAAGSRRATALSDRGKSWITAVIVLLAAGSDALFYPFVKYMVVYGVFVSAPSAFAIWRLWSRRSIKR